MSKERELLKQAEELIHTISVMASIDGVRIPTNIGIALRLEIQGLLAQPEQIDTRNGGKDVEGQIVLRL